MDMPSVEKEPCFFCLLQKQRLFLILKLFSRRFFNLHQGGYGFAGFFLFVSKTIGNPECIVEIFAVCPYSDWLKVIIPFWLK